MNFDIITDSSCNLKEDMIEEFGLTILPLTFMIDGTEHRSYVENRVTDLQKFYTMMREGKVITTSLPNLDESERKIRAVLDKGKDFRARSKQSTFCAALFKMNIPTRRSIPWTHLQHRAVRDYSSGMRCSSPYPERPSKRSTDGLRIISFISHTGSRSMI